MIQNIHLEGILMNFKKLGVVLLLIMCVVGVSLSRSSSNFVNAGNDYYNTLEVGKWYSDSEINKYSAESLKKILVSYHTSGPNLISSGVVDHHGEGNGNEYVMPLRCGNYKTWSRDFWGTNFYYWNFIRQPFNLTIQNSKTIIPVITGKTIKIVARGRDKNRENAADADVIFSLDDLNKGPVTSFSTVTNQFGEAYFSFKSMDQSFYRLSVKSQSSIYEDDSDWVLINTY
jgi:hypothetical protein